MAGCEVCASSVIHDASRTPRSERRNWRRSTAVTRRGADGQYVSSSTLLDQEIRHSSSVFTSRPRPSRSRKKDTGGSWDTHGTHGTHGRTRANGSHGRTPHNDTTSEPNNHPHSNPTTQVKSHRGEPGHTHGTHGTGSKHRGALETKTRRRNPLPMSCGEPQTKTQRVSNACVSRALA